MKKLLAIIVVLCLVFSMVPGVLAIGVKGAKPQMPKENATRKVTAGDLKSKEGETYPLYQDFEGDMTGWQLVDSDGDEKNWEIVTSETSLVYQGSKALASYSWDYVNVHPLTPDNWLISPKFTPIGELELSWFAVAADSDYADDFYSVYVSTTGTALDDFDTLVFEGTPTAKWRRQAVDLSEYDGQEIYVAFRHHNSTDEFAINLDLITVTEPLVLVPNEALSAAIDGGDGFKFYDDGEYPWAVFEDDVRSYAYSSNQGIDNSSSSFYTIVELDAGEIFEFNYKVSSERSYDSFLFCANDKIVLEMSGESMGWKTFSYVAPVTGEFVFTWSYEKDSSDSSGEDTVWVDDVKTNGFADYDVNEALNVEGGTLEFVNNGEYKWMENSIDGRTVAMSTNQGADDTECVLSTTAELQPGEIFAFDLKVSSEAGYDGFMLLINDYPVWRASGELDWDTVVLVNDSPEAGTYDFAFAYVKDVSDAEGLDTAWIDNVYAGPVPELTGIEFDEESITVPTGFSKQLNVLPMPMLAELSEITFTSDNEAVATVDENGFVTGIAVGKAKITATSKENFKAEITVDVFDGKFAIGNTLWHDDGSRIGWNLFELDKAETMFLAETDLIAYSTFALTLVNGTYYGVTESGYLYVADAKTFEYTLSDKLLSDVVMLDLTYNPKTGEFIGLGVHENEDIMELYAIDFDNLTIEVITEIETDELLLTLAANLDGELYTIAANTGKLFTLNAENGELKLVGDTGTTPVYAQSMAFDHATGELYWALYQEEMNVRNGIPYGGSIVKVNAETAELELVIEDIGEVCGFSVVYDYAEVEGTPVTGITLANRYEWVSWGEQLALDAKAVPENASIWRIEYSSDNEDVAVVDKNGVVTVVGRGVANITATTVDGGFSETCTIYSSYEMTYKLQEDFETELDGWENIDLDGDGYSWGPFSNEDFECFSGNSCYVSASYDNINGALTPNNWLVSPVFSVDEGDILSWYDIGIDKYYADENYTVYISVATPATNIKGMAEQFTTILYNGMPTGDWTQRTVDLSEYAGKDVRIAFCHHDVTDEYMLGIDLIEVKQLDTSTPLIGDINRDELFNTGDAVIILRGLVNSITLDEEQLFLADMNGDKTVKTGDAAKLLMILVHIR